MLKYPKIDTLFERDSEFIVDQTRIRRPEFGLIREWLVTEKIDGQGIRVGLTRSFVIDNGVGKYEWLVEFSGRTNKTSLPIPVESLLKNTFTVENMKALWRPTMDEETGREVEQQYDITLFLEAYGAKIQSGGEYRRDGDISIRLFDVLVAEDSWLSWENVQDIATKLGINTVPFIKMESDLDATCFIVKNGAPSNVGLEEGAEPVRLSEGIVAKADPPLFNARGQRLIWKLKTRDFGMV